MGFEAPENEHRVREHADYHHGELKQVCGGGAPPMPWSKHDGTDQYESRQVRQIKCVRHPGKELSGLLVEARPRGLRQVKHTIKESREAQREYPIPQLNPESRFSEPHVQRHE